jgi:hypothetical protein
MPASLRRREACRLAARRGRRVQAQIADRCPVRNNLDRLRRNTAAGRSRDAIGRTAIPASLDAVGSRRQEGPGPAVPGSAVDDVSQQVGVRVADAGHRVERAVDALRSAEVRVADVEHRAKQAAGALPRAAMPAVDVARRARGAPGVLRTAAARDGTAAPERWAAGAGLAASDSGARWRSCGNSGSCENC